VSPQDCSRRRSPASATVAPDCPIQVAEVGVNENTPIAAPTRRHLSLNAHSAGFYGSLGRESLVSENVCCSDSDQRGHDWRRRFHSGRSRMARVKPRRCRQVSGASAPPGPVAPWKQGTNEPSRSHDDRESDPTRPNPTPASNPTGLLAPRLINTPVGVDRHPARPR
jgi:hypothetical protein